MNANEPTEDWKLQYRYGKLNTPYRHYSIIADGVVEKIGGGFDAKPGPAFMGMKVWASSHEEAADMARVIGSHIGFVVTGDIQIYDTEPSEPPSDNPRGYGINFTPYDPHKK